MNVQDFNSAGALKDFVNDQAILQAKVQQIVVESGRWYLIWWT